MSPNVLVVEDDPDIVRVVRGYLERDGFAVDVAHDGATGLQAFRTRRPDLVVLDWMLPEMDGLEVLKAIRRDHATPVIMLTARTDETDRVLGLELGADDYVPKPFHPRELVARVRAVLRRSRGSESEGTDVLEHGPVTLDPEKRRVTLHGDAVELTTLEFDLLRALMSHPGRVFRRDELLDRVWGPDFTGVDRVVDVHVSHLRSKLEADPSDPSLVVTVRGVGYTFAEQS